MSNDYMQLTDAMLNLRNNCDSFRGYIDRAIHNGAGNDIDFAKELDRFLMQATVDSARESLQRISSKPELVSAKATWERAVESSAGESEACPEELFCLIACTQTVKAWDECSEQVLLRFGAGGFKEVTLAWGKRLQSEFILLSGFLHESVELLITGRFANRELKKRSVTALLEAVHSKGVNNPPPEELIGADSPTSCAQRFSEQDVPMGNSDVAIPTYDETDGTDGLSRKQAATALRSLGAMLQHDVLYDLDCLLEECYQLGFFTHLPCIQRASVEFDNLEDTEGTLWGLILGRTKFLFGYYEIGYETGPTEPGFPSPVIAWIKPGCIATQFPRNFPTITFLDPGNFPDIVEENAAFESAFLDWKKDQINLFYRLACELLADAILEIPKGGESTVKQLTKSHSDMLSAVQLLVDELDLLHHQVWFWEPGFPAEMTRTPREIVDRLATIVDSRGDELRTTMRSAPDGLGRLADF